MLSAILCPIWTGEGKFTERLQRWEYDIQQYEKMTGERIGDGAKCAVVLRWAPVASRDVLRRSSAEVTTSYAAGKGVLENDRVRSLAFDTTNQMPMEVDAVRWMQKEKMAKERKAA